MCVYVTEMLCITCAARAFLPPALEALAISANDTTTVVLLNFSMMSLAMSSSEMETSCTYRIGQGHNKVGLPPLSYYFKCKQVYNTHV